jgi:hypothetical protein
MPSERRFAGCAASIVGGFNRRAVGRLFGWSLGNGATTQMNSL